MASKFDPEGIGYDLETAVEAGLRPDATGKWPGVHPETGQILKGKQHPTYQETLAAIAGPSEYTHTLASNGRRQLRNPDGSISTELGVTFPDPNQPQAKDAWVNYPSIHQGKVLGEDRVAEIYQQHQGIDPETGNDFTKVYRNVDAAVEASKQRSRSIRTE